MTVTGEQLPSGEEGRGVRREVGIRQKERSKTHQGLALESCHLGSTTETAASFQGPGIQLGKRTRSSTAGDIKFLIKTAGK